MNQNKRLVVTALAIVVIIGAGALYWTKRSVPEGNGEQNTSRGKGSIPVEERIVDAAYFKDPYQLFSAYPGISGTWQVFILDLYTSDSGDGETHAWPMWIAVDQSDPDAIYFLPRDGAPANGTLTVYALNTETGELASRAVAAANEQFTYRIVGIKGAQLLLEQMDAMDSPHPCYSTWIYAYENPLPRVELKIGRFEDARTIQSMNLSASVPVFQPFAIPEEKYLTELEKEKACQSSLGT